MPNIRTRFKVYSASGEHVASTVRASDALLVARFYTQAPGHSAVAPWQAPSAAIFYATASRRIQVWPTDASRRLAKALWPASAPLAIAAAMIEDSVAIWRANGRPLAHPEEESHDADSAEAHARLDDDGAPSALGWET